MSLSLSQRVTVAPDVLFRTIGDEAVLLNLKTELYLGLDPMGTRMWILFKDSSSLEEAYHHLLQEYDVDETRLRSDLEEFIAKLLAQGLIVLRSGKSA